MKKIVKDVLFGDEKEKGYCERPESQTVQYTEQQQYQYQYQQPQQTFVQAPIEQVQHFEKPAVIQEVIRPGVREEIQPVIHRDREQLEIREELQPIYEKAVRPTIVEERQLPAETKPEVRVGAMPVLAEGPRSSSFVEAEHREQIVKPAIVEETVHRKIVEEVQPVIHREVVAPTVIHEVKPIYEKVVEAPEVHYQTLPAQYRGESMGTAQATATVATVQVTEQVLEQQKQQQQQQQQFTQAPSYYRTY